MIQRYEELEKIISHLAAEEESKLVLVHHNGDPDALGSALALKLLFPNVEVGAPLGLAKVAERQLAAVGETVLRDPDPSFFDQVIVVDTSSAIQLGEFAKRIKEPILIDHHAYNDGWPGANHVYVDPSKASCCEVVYDLIEEAEKQGATLASLAATEGEDVERVEKACLALLIGIYTDSAGFRYAHPSTFDVFSRLLQAGGLSMDDVLAVVEAEAFFDPPRKIAHMKAMKRVDWVLLKPLDLVVATSRVGSFEASAAKGISMAGADIAIVWAAKDGELRISTRARREVVKDHGVHLGETLHRVAAKHGLMGGGHDGAAGANGPGDDAKARAVADDLVAAIAARLDQRVEPGRE